MKYISDFFAFFKIEVDKIANFLFPPACVVCGKLDQNWLCEKCMQRISRLEKYQSLDVKTIIESKNIYFDEFFYCFNYEGIIRKLILKYKFSDGSYISNFFANVILKNEKIFDNYDIIIPVPMDKIKKLKRGYNQTELITDILFKNSVGKKENKVIIDNKSLRKIKHTKTQSTLNSKERQENIRDAYFIFDNNKLKGKNIILFDDIFTTGATVNEISRILKNAGVNKILVLVLAKD